jgi:hypothetical protein
MPATNLFHIARVRGEGEEPTILLTIGLSILVFLKQFFCFHSSPSWFHRSQQLIFRLSGISC